MNGRVSKILRGRARAQTVGKPQRRYTLNGGTVRLVICTRSVYRAMKMEYRNRAGWPR